MKYISTAFGILGKSKRVYSKASTKTCYAKIVNMIVDKYMYKKKENIDKEEELLIKINLYNRLLKRGRLYSTNIRQKGLMAYYHPITGDIHIKNTIANKITKNLIHEAIHKVGPSVIFNQKNIGLLEGATESIVTNIFGNANTLCRIDNMYFYLESNAYYPYQVLLVRQMDFMLSKINKINLEKNIDNMIEIDILNKNMNFKDIFINLYGKKLFKKINNFCNQLLKSNRTRTIEEINLKFSKIQNEMLKICFDTKFYELLNNDLASQKDYLNYLLELKRYEYLRAIIETDTYFEKYYIDKYMKIERICEEEGLGTEEISKHRTMNAKFY